MVVTAVLLAAWALAALLFGGGGDPGARCVEGVVERLRRAERRARAWEVTRRRRGRTGGKPRAPTRLGDRGSWR